MKSRKNCRIQKHGRCYKCEKRDGKANYVSEADARAGAFFLWANGKITLEELNDVQPYPCEHSQYWHTGHRSYYAQKLSNMSGKNVSDGTVSTGL